MEANVKPGTRCECQDHDCPEARESVPNAHREDHEPLGIAGGTGFQQCTREAVRMVTVRPEITREKLMRSRLATGPGPAWKWLYNIDDQHRGFDSIITARKFQKKLTRQVSMCAACAAWHESKVVAK